MVEGEVSKGAVGEGKRGGAPRSSPPEWGMTVNQPLKAEAVLVLIVLALLTLGEGGGRGEESWVRE